MNAGEADQILAAAAARLRERGYKPLRFACDGDCAPDPCSCFPATRDDARRHLLWMADEAQTFPADKKGKKMRWLGFVQGALWLAGDSTLEEIKTMNQAGGEA